VVAGVQPKRALAKLTGAEVEQKQEVVEEEKVVEGVGVAKLVVVAVGVAKVVVVVVVVVVATGGEIRSLAKD